MFTCVFFFKDCLKKTQDQTKTYNKRPQGDWCFRRKLRALRRPLPGPFLIVFWSLYCFWPTRRVRCPLKLASPDVFETKPNWSMIGNSIPPWSELFSSNDLQHWTSLNRNAVCIPALVIFSGSQTKESWSTVVFVHDWSLASHETPSALRLTNTALLTLGHPWKRPPRERSPGPVTHRHQITQLPSGNSRPFSSNSLCGGSVGSLDFGFGILDFEFWILSFQFTELIWPLYTWESFCACRPASIGWFANPSQLAASYLTLAMVAMFVHWNTTM